MKRADGSLICDWCLAEGWDDTEARDIEIPGRPDHHACEEHLIAIAESGDVSFANERAEIRGCSHCNRTLAPGGDCPDCAASGTPSSRPRPNSPSGSSQRGSG